MESALEIHIQDGDGQQQVRIRGDVDLATAHQLRDALVQLATSSVALDLSGVTFLDSSGIGVLLTARERIVAEGKEFTIHSASDTVRQVLTYSGLDWLLHTPAEAPPSA